jgi:hypothetical protein
MMSDWKVDLVNDNVNELYVVFKGPKDSAPASVAPPKRLLVSVSPDGFLDARARRDGQPEWPAGC